MDLFGPTRVASLSRMQYAYILVDDYSRYTWVCFLAHKNDAFKAFEVIMEPNLKMNFLKSFAMKIEFPIHSFLLELLNKMG